MHKGSFQLHDNRGEFFGVEVVSTLSRAVLPLNLLYGSISS